MVGFIQPPLSVEFEQKVSNVVHIGALVLAHSLRDGGATRKLAVLVTADTVSEDTISDLKVSSSREWSKSARWQMLNTILTLLSRPSMTMSSLCPVFAMRNPPTCS